MIKNSGIIKKIHLINYSSNKFRKTFTINRKDIKIKYSFDYSNKNDKSLENNSNINLKTAAQSKIVSEPSSIKRVQTQHNHKTKKSLFSEEKENKILNLKKIFKSNIKNEITQCEKNSVIHNYFKII